MDRKQFESLLDQHTKKWWIDVDKSNTGHLTGRIKNGVQMSSYSPNPSGYPVVLEHKIPCEFCTMCCRQVEGKRELVDLQSKVVQCKCGLKYPISIDSLIR
jgi:hypothetical protein